MSISLYISLTGLNEATTRLQVASENIANANSMGFKAQRVADKSGKDGQGVIAQVETPKEPWPFIVRIGEKAEVLSNVDLDREMTALIRAKHTFKANLKAIKVEDELMEDAVKLKK